MPLPRDRYPDLLTSETLLKLDRHRIDEARRVACEQYTRANRLERERDIARDALNEYYSMWAKAEREKRELVEVIDELNDCLIWCSGSADFNPGGQAVNGWNNMVRPVIAEAKQALAKADTP